MTDTTTPDALVDEWLTVPDVAERLELDAGKVRRLVQEGRLVGVRRGDPKVFSVPAAFLVPGHLANPSAPSRAEGLPQWTVLAALQGTLTLLRDAGFSDEEAVVWLFSELEGLRGSPIAALREGRKTEVRRLAQAEL
ncbi:Rv2175c family DNA-binding protein [Cellulomonas edaphi]|uniref:Rv2175c family DNA-binding protein n=1 Tax=Cellulomonas edaphi TaxID=3053468 RepID=A0ABT7S8P0_9CELL|nr:Rv2175c family DNA-binding protein [Cellulomons edaphi]MDM7831397.1 Rv2175c family DNA-binding protein [Cellulomons edaphi]